MRATRPHGGRDQYGIGRKANSSRPESNRLSHPDSNFYSIRAFTLSIKSSLDYGECRNCENRKSRPGGLDRSSVNDLLRDYSGSRNVRAVWPLVGLSPAI